MQDRFGECQRVPSYDVCSECSDKVCGKHGRRIIDAKNRSVSEKGSGTPSQVYQVLIPPDLLAVLLLGLPEG